MGSDKYIIWTLNDFIRKLQGKDIGSQHVKELEIAKDEATQSTKNRNGRK